MAESNEAQPQQIEERHVHSVYSEIARHFSETRYKPWPHIAEFINTLKPGSILADIGGSELESFSLHVLYSYS